MPPRSCDPDRLSAYRDDALSPTERAALEAHLLECATCRDELSLYAALGEALRELTPPAPTPIRLEARVAAVLLERSRDRDDGSEGPRVPRLLRLPVGRMRWVGGAAAALAVLLVFVGLPLGGAGGPSVAVAYPCDNPSECAVALRFRGPVDRQAVERTLRVDPPLPVTVTWRDPETLLVKPLKPAAPGQHYTLSVQPGVAEKLAIPVPLTAAPTAPARDETPAEGASIPSRTDFASAAPAAAGAAPTSAAPLPTANAGPRSTPTSDPTRPAARASASPTGAPAAPTGTPTACAPARGASDPAVVGGRAGAATRLGCALGPATRLEVGVTLYRRGILLRRGDTGETLALLADGTWRTVAGSLADSLGIAEGGERQLAGSVEPFAGGAVFSTTGGVAFVLYGGGTWEQLGSLPAAGGPTATASAAATPPASATAAPGQQAAADGSPTPIPTLAPAAAAGAPAAATQTPSPAGPTTTAPAASGAVSSTQATPAATSGAPAMSGSAVPAASGLGATPTATDRPDAPAAARTPAPGRTRTPITDPA